MRIGCGFDVHAFGPGEFVMLGGVRVPHAHGVLAHSDGDVLLHALCDALLGAAGLGDIGQHFKDTDPQWRGADSAGFVTAVLGQLRASGLRVVNADLTADRTGTEGGARTARPCRRVSPQLLAVPAGAGQREGDDHRGLGFLGRGEGIGAHAVVLLGEH